MNIRQKMRPTPSHARARGMLNALKTSHTCGEACTGLGVVGGVERRLSCPLGRLSLSSSVDRRIIGALYANEARSALQKWAARA